MKCKHLKLIMELIFIFILPLVFILPNFSIKKDIVYDNEGNYKDTNTYIDYNSNINYTYNVYDNIITCDMKWTYNATQDVMQIDIFNFSKDYLYYIPSSSGICLIALIGSGGVDIDITINKNNNIAYVDFGIAQCNISYRTNVLYNDDIYLIYFNEYSSCWISNASNYGFTDNFEENLINYGNPSLNPNSNFKYFDIVFNVFGNIRDLFVNSFHIDSFLLDIIICYTFLWFIMFIIWHFLYCLFDFIVHLVDKERRRE